MTNRKRLIGFFLTCALCFSLIVPETGFTNSQPDGKSIDHPVKLIGISVKPNTFSNVLTHLEDEQWYQFDPGKANLTNHTHLRLTLSSNAPVEISVYPSKKSAIENEPFYWYQAYADKKQSAEVDFPYAWSGPCYIKVTGFNDGEQPNSASKAINYQLHYESVNLPPATESGEPCPVELSTSQKKVRYPNHETFTPDKGWSFKQNKQRQETDITILSCISFSHCQNGFQHQSKG
ncbi:hypothetical protein RWE15_12400 [Virgibacillus halophilus]|uniref:Uncharacterized protein n=1 Tax=Tigheibacillus halophilus TaxID=361280 RepID=A0ABU5C6Y2_9BACI|nr:hypothetical protein [Virgibacillus halophilus]